MLPDGRITGATPGRPFMFLIPASGDEPLTFSVKNLPAGLTVDAKTGLIAGSLKQAGRTVVDYSALIYDANGAILDQSTRSNGHAR